MYHDIDFWPAVKFTLLLVAVIVPIQFVLALVMALLVNSTLRGRSILLFVFIVPLAVSDLAAGLVWQSIFTENGYLNTILEGVGILDHPQIWIDQRHSNWLLGEVVLTEMWRSTAFIMIILVAGLQGIPKEYGEAAEVFGAGFFQRLRTVVLPMLKPALQVALLLRIIFAFEVFASVIAITGRAKTTLAGQALRWQGEYFDSHVAAAYALLILALSLVSAALVLRLVRTPRERMLR
jgi:multiple sugar transport system permease protein